MGKIKSRKRPRNSSDEKRYPIGFIFDGEFSYDSTTQPTQLLQKGINISCRKTLSIFCERGGILPAKYDYLEEGESGKRTPEQCKHVIYSCDDAFNQRRAIPQEYTEYWKKLERMGKDQLLLLLGEMRRLSFMVKFEDGAWVDNKDKPEDEDLDVHIEELVTIIADGRSKEQFRDDLNGLQKSNWECPRLSASLAVALEEKMNNGAARGPLQQLLSRMGNIVQGAFPSETIGVTQITTPFPADDTATGELSDASSTSSHRSSSSTCRSVSLTSSSGSLASMPNSEVATPTKEKTKGYSSHFIDMKMFCSNGKNDGKNILLVEILSDDDCREETQVLFVKQLILTLQNQREGFGLIVSDRDAVIYRAVRSQSNDINISYTTYTYQNPQRMSVISWSRLQLFCMDLLTCLFYAVKEI